ncbi:hypothetical protein [Lentzea sp. CA-135723]|uniref:hypothetical protein n=1 Tax=Lentzea sp. CA-135723 TaxID=3239950 RepID=UPI003D91F48C
MLKGNPQAVAVLGLLALGSVVGIALALLDVEAPWTYVVTGVVVAVAVAFMMRRFHR